MKNVFFAGFILAASFGSFAHADEETLSITTMTYSNCRGICLCAPAYYMQKAIAVQEAGNCQNPNSFELKTIRHAGSARQNGQLACKYNITYVCNHE